MITKNNKLFLLLPLLFLQILLKGQTTTSILLQDIDYKCDSSLKKLPLCLKFDSIIPIKTKQFIVEGGYLLGIDSSLSIDPDNSYVFFLKFSRRKYHSFKLDIPESDYWRDTFDMKANLHVFNNAPLILKKSLVNEAFITVENKFDYGSFDLVRNCNVLRINREHIFSCVASPYYFVLIGNTVYVIELLINEYRWEEYGFLIYTYPGAFKDLITAFIEPHWYHDFENRCSSGIAFKGKKQNPVPLSFENFLKRRASIRACKKALRKLK